MARSKAPRGSATEIEFVAHYHSERNRQGKGNLLLFPRKDDEVRDSSDPVVCRPRLGGLLKFYRRVA